MTGGHGKLQHTVGIAHGINAVAHIHGITVAEDDGLKAVLIYFDHGQVLVLLRADNLAHIDGGIMGAHGDIQPVLDRLFHHMVVSEDIPVLGNEETGTADHRRRLIAEHVIGHQLHRHVDHLPAGQIINLGGGESVRLGQGAIAFPAVGRRGAIGPAFIGSENLLSGAFRQRALRLCRAGIPHQGKRPEHAADYTAEKTQGQNRKEAGPDPFSV